MKTSLKTACYGLLGLSLLWTSCGKKGSNNGGGGSTTGGTEFLAKIASVDMADSTLFFYNSNTLKSFAHEYTVLGALNIDAYFPVYVNNVISALNEGPDTSSTTASMYYNFLLDASKRISIASAQSISQPYYDSLVYDGSGHLSVVYTFLGSPAGSAVLDYVVQLTWDASNDVTQVYAADSLPGIATNYFYAATLTYDAKTNPYGSTQASLLLALLQNNYYTSLGVHNVLTAVITEVDQTNQSVENDAYTYTYDAAGNPVTLSFAATVKGSTATSNSVYTYVKM